MRKRGFMHSCFEERMDAEHVPAVKTRRASPTLEAGRTFRKAGWY